MTPADTRDTIGVVIPTKNSAKMIGECLQSVKWADEVIVVDMRSTDATTEICGQYPNVRVFEREDYIFGNVNFGFEQVRSDWTLRLDSDERVTPGMAAEIQEILRNPPAGVTGFHFNQRLVVLGAELRHGRGRAVHRDMMFRTGAALYAVQHEHESLTTSGRWVRARSYYIHLNYTEVAEYLTKTNYYTSRDVERMDLPVRCPSTMTGAIACARAFYLYYLKQQGFRDGWPGFVDASMMALYQLVQWAKVVERWRRENGGGAGD